MQHIQQWNIMKQSFNNQTTSTVVWFFSFSSSRGRFSMFIRGVSVFSTNFSDNSTFRSFLFQNEDRIDIPSQKGEKENI